MTEFELAWEALSFGGELRWFCRRGGDKLGGVARSPGELAERSSANARGYDCYVQLNPAVGFRGLRTRAVDVTHLRGFLLDLDPDPGHEPPAWMEVELDKAAREIGHYLDTLEWIRPWYVDSGRGMQAWFLGAPAAVDSPGWRETVQRTVSFIVRRLVLPPGVHADPMVCDVSRVVRLPGTTNTKTGRLARVLEAGNGAGYLWPTILRCDPGLPPDQARPVLERSPDTYRMVWTHLTRSAQDFITQGWTYPGRHSILWHTADLLAKLGLTRAAATRALWMGAQASSPPLKWEEVKYAVGRAYGGKIGD